MRYERELDKLMQIMTAAREIDPVLPSQCLHVLLAVGHKPGSTREELGKVTELSPASILRNLRTLGLDEKSIKTSFELTEARKDPENTRRELVFLTIKGRQFTRRVLSILTGQSAQDYEPTMASNIY